MKKEIDYLIEALQKIKENDELIDELLYQVKADTSSAKKAKLNKKMKGGGRK